MVGLKVSFSNTTEVGDDASVCILKRPLRSQHLAKFSECGDINFPNCHVASCSSRLWSCNVFSFLGDLK